MCTKCRRERGLPALEHLPPDETAELVVSPDDTGWLQPTDGDALTLVTCYPFGASPTSPLRYVVRALPR